jgi:hypothetical protein
VRRVGLVQEIAQRAQQRRIIRCARRSAARRVEHGAAALQSGAVRAQRDDEA